MQYSNIGIVTNVAIPYDSKDDSRDLEQKQLQQQHIQTTNTTSTTNTSTNSNTTTSSNTELPDDKNSNADILLSGPFRQATLTYQDYSSKYIQYHSYYS